MCSVFPYSAKLEKFPLFNLAWTSGEGDLFKEIILFSQAQGDVKCFVLTFCIVFYFQNDLWTYHCQMEIHLIEGKYSTECCFWKCLLYSRVGDHVVYSGLNYSE